MVGDLLPGGVGRPGLAADDTTMNLMGVDLGIHKVATFILYGDERAHGSVLDRGDQGRAYQLHSMSSYVHSMVTSHEVDSVWIEDTIIGNNRHYSIQLAETKGALMAALAMHVDVRLVDNKTWKKHVLGSGNATKDQVKDYIDVTYGAYAPLCGDDQDLYDAACIALYGRQITDRAATLHL